MRINTNVSAMQAYGNLSKVQDQLSSSMEKLSSGFRINKAGDDAAGLGIANQLRGDIGAMQQASDNADQASSVLQIMDGATQNVQSILERMKELAAQSASDTVDDSARTKIDNEFQSLSDELDRIVNTTKFEGANLLDGSFGSKVTTSGAVNLASSSFDNSSSVSSVAVASSSTLQGVTSNITASVVKSGNTVASGATGVTGVTVGVLNQSTVDSLDASTPVLVSSTFQSTAVVNSGAQDVVDGVNVTGITADDTASGSGSLVAGATYHFVATTSGSDVSVQLQDSSNANVGTAVTVSPSASSFTVSGLTFSLSGSLDQAGTVSALNNKTFEVSQQYQVGLTGGGLANQNATIVDDGSSHTLNFGNYGVSLAIGTGKASALDGKTLAVTENDSLKLSGTTASGAVTQSIAINGGTQAMNFSTFGLTVNLGSSATAAGLKSDITGGLNTIVQGGTRQAQFLVSASQSYSNNDLINLDAISLSAASLGVDKTSIHLTSAASAQSALTAIDGAITQVGNALGSIGAAENRIGYASSNVKTSIENFTSAESTIRDVDMASEMTNFSKEQILSQAGTAMLAQANQLGASVLKLLQ